MGSYKGVRRRYFVLCAGAKTLGCRVWAFQGLGWGVWGSFCQGPRFSAVRGAVYPIDTPFSTSEARRPGGPRQTLRPQIPLSLTALRPAALIINPEPQRLTLNPQPSTLNPQPSTLNPQPSTLNPQPSTLNPQPSTLNPAAEAGGGRGGCAGAAWAAGPRKGGV